MTHIRFARPFVVGKELDYIADVGADGRNELPFRYNHPLVWQYLMTEFEPIETPELPDCQQFLRRKESLQ